MNISSISSGANIYFPTQNNNEIRALEKQRERLQAQIQKTKESDTDTRTKQELIKQLQEQMQQIEMQIQQKKSEILSKEKDRNEDGENKDKSGTTEIENTANSVSANRMTDFFEASTAYDKAKLVSGLKRELDGRGRVLSGEIALNEARGFDSEGKKSALADVKTKSMSLNIELGEALHDSRNQVEETAKAQVYEIEENGDQINGADKETEETNDRTGRNEINREGFLLWNRV